MNIMNKINLINTYEDIKYIEVDMHDNTEIEKIFITTWIKDDNKRIYKYMDFLPKNEINIIHTDHTFNLFNGWSDKVLTSYDVSLTDKYLKPFHDLGIELCGGSQEYYNYLIKFFAHMIQKPYEKNAYFIYYKRKARYWKKYIFKLYRKYIK
jgi:hypothetical protein